MWNEGRTVVGGACLRNDRGGESDESGAASVDGLVDMIRRRCSTWTAEIQGCVLLTLRNTVVPKSSWPP
jgi:hypothetical protein